MTITRDSIGLVFSKTLQGDGIMFWYAQNSSRVLKFPSKLLNWFFLGNQTPQKNLILIPNKCTQHAYTQEHQSFWYQECMWVKESINQTCTNPAYTQTNQWCCKPWFGMILQKLVTHTFTWKSLFYQKRWALGGFSVYVHVNICIYIYINISQPADITNAHTLGTATKICKIRRLSMRSLDQNPLVRQICQSPRHCWFVGWLHLEHLKRFPIKVLQPIRCSD